jgi:hypothetical protein
VIHFDSLAPNARSAKSQAAPICDRKRSHAARHFPAFRAGQEDACCAIASRISFLKAAPKSKTRFCAQCSKIGGYSRRDEAAPSLSESMCSLSG